MAFDDRFIATGHVDEIPGVERDQGQGYNLQCRKDSRNGEIELGLPGPIPVVTRADEASTKIQDGVEVNRAQRRYPLHQAHLVENDGDNDGDKELKEPFHP